MNLNIVEKIYHFNTQVWINPEGKTEELVSDPKERHSKPTDTSTLRDEVVSTLDKLDKSKRLA